MHSAINRQTEGRLVGSGGTEVGEYGIIDSSSLERHDNVVSVPLCGYHTEWVGFCVGQLLISLFISLSHNSR